MLLQLKIYNTNNSRCIITKKVCAERRFITTSSTKNPPRSVTTALSNVTKTKSQQNHQSNQLSFNNCVRHFSLDYYGAIASGLDPSKLEDFAKRTSKMGRRLGESKSEPTNFKVLQPRDTGSYIPGDLLKERYSKTAKEWSETVDFDAPEALDNFDNTYGARMPPASLPVMSSARPQKVTQLEDGTIQSLAYGSRKASKAEVILTSPGTGKVSINNRSLVDYFPIFTSRERALEPLLVIEQLGVFDVRCRVFGGGYMGQANAMGHALSNALQQFEPEWRPVLKKAGFLERDERIVERKKPGQPKARKKYQWSKR